MRSGTYRIIIGLVVLTLPLVGWSAFQSLQTNANSPLDWVPDTFPARADYDAFCRQFGSGDVVIMSWPGCTLEDVRIDRVVRYLRASKSFFDEDYQWNFERIVTGREIYQKLVGSPLKFSPDEAKRRLRGTLLGPDDETTCLIVTFTPEAVARRREIVPLIHAVLKTCDVPLEDQHLAGPVIDGLSVDEAGRQSMAKLAVPSALMVFFIGYWCLKSFRAACLVFLLSLYAQLVTLALLHLGGETMSALLIVLPPLIQVLSVAGGIHLVHYYWEAVRNGNAHHAAEAFRVGWLPCTLASATTAFGLASLMVSDLSPVQLFGTYGAAGVLLTAGLLLAVLPATLKRWPVPPPADDDRLRPLWGHQWSRLHRGVCRLHWLLLLVVIATIGFAASGLQQLQTSVRVETLFSPQSRILSDCRWLEDNVAPLVPIDIMIRFPVNEHWPLTKQLAFVRQVEKQVSAVEPVSGTLSAQTFLPREEDVSQGAGIPSASLSESLLRFALPELITANFVAHAQGDWEWFSSNGLKKPEYRDWRITAHVSAVEELDYGELLNQIERRVDPLVPDTSDRSSQQIRITYTGIMPLVHAIQHRLMANLFQSFLTAVGTIALTMILLQGGVLVGLISMIPNIFPPVVLLGSLGWAGVKLDIGSVMTISVGLGIAVDDTLHFLVNFQRAVDAGMTRREAVRQTFHDCGAAMVQTSITCGLGLLMFALSDFVPTARFAWMMLAFLMLALIGDLLLLPALLISPFGICFQRQSEWAPRGELDQTRSSPKHSGESPGESPVKCRINGTA